MKKVFRRLMAAVLVCMLCLLEAPVDLLWAANLEGSAGIQSQTYTETGTQTDTAAEDTTAETEETIGTEETAGTEESTEQIDVATEIFEAEDTESETEETFDLEEKRTAASSYVNLTGICYLLQKTGIDAGVAYESNASGVEFRWMSYNLDTGVWSAIADWNNSNWMSWHPDKGNYWLHVEARTNDGATGEYTISFCVDRNYSTNYLDLSGICYLVKDAQIDAGVAYESGDANVQFRWMSYNLDTGVWETISDWSSGNWTSWKPKVGNYWLYVEAKNQSGNTNSFTICFAVDRDYADDYIKVNGICMQQQGRNVNLGAAYESSDPNTLFKWEVYDLSTGQWTTITDWAGGNWTTWTPKSGNYWVNVTAKISSGQETSHCIGLSLNMGEIHSKKGIEGNYGIYSDPDLNVTNVLENTHLGSWISDTPTSEYYVYNGKTYYFNPNPGLDAEVRTANSRGIKISLVLLMPWDSNHKNMIIPYAWDNGGHRYYALNGYDPQVCALFGYLAQHYGQPDCHIDNWILGNEVNMPTQYHYTGTLDVNTNASIYAEEFRALYNALQSWNPYGKAYISLDHSWTHNDEGRGIAGRDFLYAFYYAMNEKQANVNWNIAYHLYTPIMTSSRMWAPEYVRYTPQNENAEFISAVNLNVLTDFVRYHFGTKTRIILSEQGFDYHEGT